MSPSKPTGTGDRTLPSHPEHTPTDGGEALPIDTDSTVHAPPRTDGGGLPGAALPVVEPSHYSVLGELAWGGLGRILRARDLRLDRPVALKEMLAPAREAESVDLLAIVTQAMAREPARRYATARELAEDLRRFQTGQIVGAYQYSRMELLRRFVRRYRAVLTVIAVAVLLLATLGGVGLLRVLTERDAANTARQQAQTERDAADTARQHAQTQADKLLLMRAREAVVRAPNGAVAWLRELSPGTASGSSPGATGLVTTVAFFPDGRTLVSTGQDGSLRLWADALPWEPEALSAWMKSITGEVPVEGTPCS